MKNKKQPKNQLNFYVDAVKEMRRVSPKFTASDGYDLRKAKDWTPQRRAAISRRYKEYLHFLDELPQDMLPTRQVRNIERRESLRAWSGVEYPKWLDVEFVPKPTATARKPAKIEWTKNNNPIFKVRGNIRYGFLPFNKTNLLIDPDGEAERLINKAIAMGAKSYAIRNGKHTMGANFATPETLVDQLIKLMNRYDPKEDASAQSDFRDWLNGIEYYTTEVGAGYDPKTSDEGKFLQELSASRSVVPRKARKARAQKFSRKTGQKLYRPKNNG